MTRETGALLGWGMSAGTARYLLRNIQTRKQMAAFAVLAILREDLADAGDTVSVARAVRRIGATSIAIVSVRWALEGLGPERRPFSLPALPQTAFWRPTFWQPRHSATGLRRRAVGQVEDAGANGARRCTKPFTR